LKTQEYSVAVRPDFLERQAKASPIQTLSELIWNALDADATQVRIEFEPDGLGGVAKIIVSDNGDGMPHGEAPQLFSNLGGSWKRQRITTRERGRILHGREGRGRFKAFTLGSVLDWNVVYEKDGTLSRFAISMIDREIERVRVSDEEPYPDGVRGTSTSKKGLTTVLKVSPFSLLA
jgi:DNA topoisomerase VI subunit B